MALPRTITHRELRSDSGNVMRSLDRGDSFIVTRDGIPYATLALVNAKHFTETCVVLEAFRSAPTTDAAAFGADVDLYVDQSREARA